MTPIYPIKKQPSKQMHLLADINAIKSRHWAELYCYHFGSIVFEKKWDTSNRYSKQEGTKIWYQCTSTSSFRFLCSLVPYVPFRGILKNIKRLSGMTDKSQIAIAMQCDRWGANDTNFPMVKLFYTPPLCFCTPPQDQNPFFSIFLNTSPSHF